MTQRSLRRIVPNSFGDTLLMMEPLLGGLQKATPAPLPVLSARSQIQDAHVEASAHSLAVEHVLLATSGQAYCHPNTSQIALRIDSTSGRAGGLLEPS